MTENSKHAKLRLLPAFNVIGLSVRTTNENGQSGQDIPALWGRFIAEGIADKIPARIGTDVYCIYTDYEKDHLHPYTVILGCPVASLDVVPEELTGRSFAEGTYAPHLVKGNIHEGMVFDAWMKIWAADLPRVFAADFEVYGAGAQNPENAEVEIFISVKS